MSKVYIVGAGPGDPELLTLKAVRVLQRADVVLYDRLVAPAVLEWVPVTAERVPVGKRHGEQERVQREIYRLMLEHARAGRAVVRLKGGDPFVFGRGGEEWRYLAAHGVPVEVVPGVTSALAVPGLAGIPLTFRGVSRGFAVVTGHCAGGGGFDARRYAEVETLVILMGVRRRAEIARELIAAGRAPTEPVAFVERGSTPEARVVVTTLAAVAANRVAVAPPAVFVVGPVVALRGQLMHEETEVNAC